MEFAGRVGKYEICAGSNQCKSKSFSIEAHTKDGLRRKMIPRKHVRPYIAFDVLILLLRCLLQYFQLGRLFIYKSC